MRPPRSSNWISTSWIIPLSAPVPDIRACVNNFHDFTIITWAPLHCWWPVRQQSPCLLIYLTRSRKRFLSIYRWSCYCDTQVLRPACLPIVPHQVTNQSINFEWGVGALVVDWTVRDERTEEFLSMKNLKPSWQSLFLGSIREQSTLNCKRKPSSDVVPNTWIELRSRDDTNDQYHSKKPQVMPNWHYHTIDLFAWLAKFAFQVPRNSINWQFSRKIKCKSRTMLRSAVCHNFSLGSQSESDFISKRLTTKHEHDGGFPIQL